MELIDDKIFQRILPIAGPESCVAGPEQQVVEHLVIGKQDVGRRKAHGVLVRDDSPRPHHLGRLFLVLTHENARGDLAFELQVIPDQTGKPLCLVSGKGIHGIDEDSLDARLAAVAPAVIEDGIEEALRFP